MLRSESSLLAPKRAHAWKVGRALGPLLQAQLETFVSELSVHLALDSDRMRYEFPIKKETRLYVS